MVHPKYNFFTYENDLALVRLEKKVPFQPNIVPICLPGNDDLLIGKSLILDLFGSFVQICIGRSNNGASIKCVTAEGVRLAQKLT